LHSDSSTLVTALASMMNETEKNKVVKPSMLKKAVNKELTMFYGFDQCDAQEFLMFFLNQIAEDLRRFSADDETETIKEQNDDENSHDEQQAGKEIGSDDESKDEKDDSITPPEPVDEGKNGDELKINQPKVMADDSIEPSNHKGRRNSSKYNTKTDAVRAWEKDYKDIDSPIKDLFAGQTACTVT
jgi:hypothetical protein